jgi:uncharacterized protein
MSRNLTPVCLFKNKFKLQNPLKMKTSLAFLLLMAASLPAAGQKANHEYDSTLAKELGADERGMKTYVLVILKTGPAEIQDKELRDSLFAGHFSNMDRLAAEKKLVAAGPFSTNERQYRGLFLFDVRTPEEAMELVKGDPTVTSGIFDLELYKWYGSAALPVYLETAEKIRKR